jgi:hypothetical protein
LCDHVEGGGFGSSLLSLYWLLYFNAVGSWSWRGRIVVPFHRYELVVADVVVAFPYTAAVPRSIFDVPDGCRLDVVVFRKFLSQGFLGHLCTRGSEDRFDLGVDDVDWPVRDAFC